MRTPRMFGVELEGYTDECMIGESIETGDEIYFQGKSDGSLSDDDDDNRYGVEFVSPPIDDTSYISEVYQALNDRYGWTVDNSAGLHIHVDAKDYEPKDFYKLLLMMVAVEPIIYSITSSFRYEHSGYARPLSNRRQGVLNVLDWNIGEIISMTQVKFTTDRYTGLNFDAYSCHDTVEFRYFAPQQEADKVVKYVELVTKIVEFVKHATIDQIRVIVKDLIDVGFGIAASRLQDVLDLSFDLEACRENSVFDRYHRVDIERLLVEPRQTQAV